MSLWLRIKTSKIIKTSYSLNRSLMQDAEHQSRILWLNLMFGRLPQLSCIGIQLSRVVPQVVYFDSERVAHKILGRGEGSLRASGTMCYSCPGPNCDKSPKFSPDQSLSLTTCMGRGDFPIRINHWTGEANMRCL